MSIHLNPVAAGIPAYTGIERRPDAAREAGLGAPTRVAEQPTKSSEATALAPASTLSAQAPEGVDPNLWTVLTDEERSFFATAKRMGPLTYTPGMNNHAMPSTRLGGRLDVRV